MPLINYKLKGGIEIMYKKCPYLIIAREIDLMNTKTKIFKCILGNTLLKEEYIYQKWACKGCTVPTVMKNRPCKYLEPQKSFSIKGKSYTCYKCRLLNIIMENNNDFCHINCKSYEI